MVWNFWLLFFFVNNLTTLFLETFVFLTWVCRSPDIFTPWGSHLTWSATVCCGFQNYKRVNKILISGLVWNKMTYSTPIGSVDKLRTGIQNGGRQIRPVSEIFWLKTAKFDYTTTANFVYESSVWSFLAFSMKTNCRELSERKSG